MPSSNHNYQPVLIHPAIESVSGELSDLFTRFDLYGRSYKKSGGKYPLLIYCAIHSDKFSELDLAQYKNLEIIRVCNSSRWTFYFIARVYFSILLRKLKPSILIAGDLKLGLYVSLILRFIFLRKFGIQVSLHGIPSVGRFSKNKRISDLYLRSLSVCFRAASSVRVVSDGIAEFAELELGVSAEKIIVCQVPITSWPVFLDKRNQEFVVGVVGRLHPERGIENIVRILTPLLSSNKKIQLVIVGKGNLGSLVQTWRDSSSFRDQVEIFGEVSQSELQGLWGRINVLLSAAPSEGYGLALREALISGAIVVAKKSDGAIALQREFETGIKLFETNKQAVQILTDLVTNLESQRIDPNIGLLQSETDRIALEKLALSWSKSIGLTPTKS